ncbi:hypothetical protein LINGRAHAP2_LOCUS15731 [Linum grandiflorum]
MSFLHGLR